MLENVSMVEARVSTEDAENDFIMISKTELANLQQERDEYRGICLDFAKEVPELHEIADRINTILNGGANE